MACDQLIDLVDHGRQHRAFFKHVFDGGCEGDENDGGKRSQKAVQEAFQDGFCFSAGQDAREDAEDQEIGNQHDDRVPSEQRTQRTADDQPQRDEKEDGIDPDDAAAVAGETFRRGFCISLRAELFVMREGKGSGRE